MTKPKNVKSKKVKYKSEFPYPPIGNLAAEIPEPKVNKKNAMGALKSPTSAIPPVAIFALGAAMNDGAQKYEAFNYRDSEVTASVFFNAAMRHLLDWWNGENFAPDSKVHHLGHLMACAAIPLDGMAQGNFIDDRPKKQPETAPSRDTTVWKMS